MNPYKTRKMAKVVAFIIVIAMLVTSFSFIFFLPSLVGAEGSVVYAASNDDEYLNKQTETLKTLIRYIQQNYKDTVSTEQLMEGALNGVITSLGDPFSVYYETPEDGQNFEESISGVFYGIGIVMNQKNGKVIIQSTVAGTPAQKAGIQTGDVIVGVDGKNVEGYSLDEIGDLTKGKDGTQVTLTVDRNGQTLSFTMKRELISEVSVFPKMLDNHIAYIQITNFDLDTDKEFAQARQEMLDKGAESFIIDVRNNPGGFVNTAAGVAEYLMPTGPISYFTQQGKLVETLSATSRVKEFYPTVLLINGGSASASEILAGALKDSGAATLVGTTTYGKGVAQQIVNVTDHSSMKLSMYYFETPKKHVIDHVGISPDVTIESGLSVNAEALLRTYASLAPMTEKTKAQKGDTSLNVYGAQQRLLLLGYDVEVTGTMDDKTVAAVKKFQEENGLSPYGVLDLTTVAKIDAVVLRYIAGVDGKTDLQLQKAVELLKDGKVSKVQ